MGEGACGASSAKLRSQLKLFACAMQIDISLEHASQMIAIPAISTALTGYLAGMA
jgi:hypothetical protein